MTSKPIHGQTGKEAVQPSASLPWRMRAGSSIPEDGGFYILSASGDEITCLDSYSSEADEKDADYIVRACNSFPDLLSALEAIISADADFRASTGKGFEGDPLTDAIDKAREAIRKATQL